MHRVAVLLLPPVVGFDAAIAPTLFSNATDADGRCALRGGDVRADAGPVAATTGFDVLPARGARGAARPPTRS